MVGDLEINRPDSKTLAGFSAIRSSNTTHKGELKRREGLFNHLEKSIASNKNSKLSVFGSAESGLSIKGGDYDVLRSDADQKGGQENWINVKGAGYGRSSGSD